MALRTAHGEAAKYGAKVVVEVPPADELRPFAAGDAAARGRTNGARTRFKPGDAAAKRGGVLAAKKRVANMAQRAQLSALGLGDLTKDPTFVPYVEEAEHFREAQARELADLAGGSCGIGPSSMIASAALQLAGSRFLFVSAGRMSDVIEAAKVFARASSIADSSRQNILAAFHLAELMARSKGQKRPRGSAAEAAQRAMAQLEQRRETEGSEGG